MLLYILISLVILILVYYLQKNKDYWKKRNIVQLDKVLWQFTFSDRSLAEIYKKIYDDHKEESCVGIFLGSKPALILRDLEDIQAVLASDFQSFHSRGITISPNDVLADNVLFIDDYNRWKVIRQRLTPVFTSAKLKNMFYILDKCGQDFVKFIQEKPALKDKPFNALYTYTTGSIGASVFGIDAQVSSMDSPFLDMAWKAIAPSLFIKIIFAIENTFPELFKLFDLKIFKQFEEFFVGVVKSVLKSRAGSTEKRHDFIDICLELQKAGVIEDPSGYSLKVTDELLAAQAFFFFIAGADTSANSMHFTLIELSNNPDILEKLHKELDAAFENDELTFNDVDKLQYFDMVFSEALRKYPPVGLLTRRCTKNTVLPASKTKIEKDVIMIVPAYGIHRDETYYPNPDVFDPERFAPENVSKIPKYANLSFGEGNRICIGARFARLQVKAGLAWLLRRFTLKPKKIVIDKFEPSAFSLRSADAEYELIPRN